VGDSRDLGAGGDSGYQNVNHDIVPRHAACPGDVYSELPHLLTFARRLTRNHHDAHDLVQDALVRALPTIGRVSAGPHLRAWLTTIVRHVHIDRLRRVAREPVAVPIDETRIGDVPDDATDEEDALSMEDIQEALGTLPELFRRVFVLHELEGRPYREIATALDIPVATVGTRLARARLKLRQLLSNKRADRGAPGAPSPHSHAMVSTHAERGLLGRGMR
jgi:RNA polymerase sigma-70 factor, ECF subfamily